MYPSYGLQFVRQLKRLQRLRICMHILTVSNIVLWLGRQRFCSIRHPKTRHPPSAIPYSVASRWRWIACNECVLELYHLRSRLGKIVSVGFQKCPSVRSFVDFSKLREARKKLDELFPDIEKLRHAIAHKGENEAHSDVHATDGQYALTGFRESDRFSTPYEGQLRSLDITMQSLQKIEEVVFDFLESFKPATVALEQQGHLD